MEEDFAAVETRPKKLGRWWTDDRVHTGWRGSALEAASVSSKGDTWGWVRKAVTFDGGGVSVD